MESVTVSVARNTLRKLVDSGEIVTITKRGRPVATLYPISQKAADVAARIRASPCINATTDEIVALVRTGRR